ncbi:MAG: hypothetical protein ACE5IZ_07285 [Dehalococcoidia bacterium]
MGALSDSHRDRNGYTHPATDGHEDPSGDIHTVANGHKLPNDDTTHFANSYKRPNNALPPLADGHKHLSNALPPFANGHKPPRADEHTDLGPGSDANSDATVNKPSHQYTCNKGDQLSHEHCNSDKSRNRNPFAHAALRQDSGKRFG